MSKGMKAEALFLEGYNCAQAVLMAFAEEVNLDEKTLAKLASSFGGGMGRMREVCGAVSGMLMVAGLLYGYDQPTPEEDLCGQEKKQQHYQLIQDLAAEFKENHETIICREILELSEGPDCPTPAKRTNQYYEERPCQSCVRDAADIMEKFLKKLNK